MAGTTRLGAELIYGAGLRVHECVTLRAKDIDLLGRTVSIRDSKGSNDRATALPEQLRAQWEQQWLRAAVLHQEELSHGAGLAPMRGRASIHRPPFHSLGSLYFLQRCCGPGVSRGVGYAGTPPIRLSNGLSSKPLTEREFANTRAFIVCAIALRPISWRPEQTFARFNLCWVIAICRRP